MAFGEEYSSTLLVQVKGAPLPPDLAAMLTDGYVDDSTNVPDLFVLRYSDENATFLEKSSVRIGDPVTLAVQRSGPAGPAPLLSGEVTALETELGSDGAYTVVRGLDHSHRLFRGRRVEAYLQSTAADIARAVAGRAGLGTGRIDAPGPVLEHVAQDGVNDWDFLRRLADEAGALLFVADGALHFTTATDAGTAPSGQGGARQDPLVVERGVNLLMLRGTVTSADQVPDVEVRGWDVDGKREIVAVAPARTPSAVLDGARPADLAGTFRSPRYVAPATVFGQPAQCEAAATALAAHLAGGFAELDGVARGNPRLRSGAAVSLVGVGKPFEGRYTLSSARHEFNRETGYRTSFTVSHASERSLYGVATGAGVRTGRSGAFPGVLNAVVTAVQDPQGQGRVKVKFPLLSDTFESAWARTVQPGAGAGRGAVVLPSAVTVAPLSASAALASTVTFRPLTVTSPVAVVTSIRSLAVTVTGPSERISTPAAPFWTTETLCAPPWVLRVSRSSPGVSTNSTSIPVRDTKARRSIAPSVEPTCSPHGLSGRSWPL